jgi:predicted AAA+ superfamily ATPase
LVVLDEVQRQPGLFEVLRVLADRQRTPARFLVLGSASPALLRQSSETLAGRIAFYDLGGFSLVELPPRELGKLWLRGGFPRSFLARTNSASAAWRAIFVRTFLERDLPQLGVGTAAATLRRFWSMLAHVHGQTLNWSELGRSLGVADTTVRSYLDQLEGALVVHQLKPWFENISKRQVRAPKIYVKDTGLLHTLLDIETKDELDGHPKAGASWEGFAIREVILRLGVRDEQCFFWATHAGAELDLLVVAGRRRLGFEVKLTDAPAITPSMRAALHDLRLDSLDVLCAANDTYELMPKVRAVPVSRIWKDIRPLRR